MDILFLILDGAAKIIIYILDVKKKVWNLTNINLEDIIQFLIHTDYLIQKKWRDI